MSVLLDTHIILSLLRRDMEQRYPAITQVLAHPATIGFVSVFALNLTVNGGEKHV